MTISSQRITAEKSKVATNTLLIILIFLDLILTKNFHIDELMVIIIQYYIHVVSICKDILTSIYQEKTLFSNYFALKHAGSVIFVSTYNLFLDGHLCMSQ